MIKYNRKIDVIIPAYNVPDKILFRCLASIACQDIVNDLEVTIIDDGSIEQNYLSVAQNFNLVMKINIFRYEENKGPGAARQYGIDHTSNEYLTFIDADDTFNGSFALKALRNGIELDNGINQMCVGIFDEVFEEGIPNGEGPVLVEHVQDLIWMFGKLYRRSFIDKYNIRFHKTSRANEDNGFNTICRLSISDEEQIRFIPAHVYYWHENLNSITRINNGQYEYGGSEKDSFYGYIENMIYAIKESKKNNPHNEYITLWAVNCMVYIYIYYMECISKSPEYKDNNFEYCKWYYNEIYKNIENNISKEILAHYYTENMRNDYINNKLTGVIPCMTMHDFINKLKND